MRVGINVPDELLRRVKEIRPQVNVSQVCRQALERRVEIAEMAKAQAIADDVDEDVDRLAQSIKAPMIEPDWAAHTLLTTRGIGYGRLNRRLGKGSSTRSMFLRKQGRDEAEMVDVWSAQSETAKDSNTTCSANAGRGSSINSICRLESGGGPDPCITRPAKSMPALWLGYLYEARRKLEKPLQE